MNARKLLFRVKAAEKPHERTGGGGEMGEGEKGAE